MSSQQTSLSAEAFTLFRELLRVDTTNPPGNERPAAELLARVFEREGIAYRLIESAPTRTSIVARLPGRGEHGPLLLNGHLDVVPVDREHWSRDPFGAEVADGYLWGRGAIDMKNMVAMSAMTLVGLKRAGVTLGRDVIFAGVADEEAGSRFGAVHLVEKHPDLVRAEYVLNEVGGYTLHFGSQRFYPVQVSEKGICWFEIIAEGEPGHGSMPHPDNAVVKLSRALDALGRARLPQHTSPVVENFLRTLASALPGPRKRIMPLVLQPALAGFLLDLLGKQSPDQARGIDAMLRNTASPTMLAAGQKVNVIPSSAKATIDGRMLPGQAVEDFLREIRRVIGPELKLNVIEQHEGAEFNQHTPLYDAISQAIERHEPGAVTVPYLTPGFTDSFAYGRLGATCYGFAPVKLPQDLSFTKLFHGHDERIPVDGFHWGFGVLYDLVERFCSAS